MACVAQGQCVRATTARTARTTASRSNGSLLNHAPAQTAQGGDRPHCIPSNPSQVYAGVGGWVSYPDWLGYAKKAASPLAPFLFVAPLSHSWPSSAPYPSNSNPTEGVQDDDGDDDVGFLPFAEARADVRKRKFASHGAWTAWCEPVGAKIVALRQLKFTPFFSAKMGEIIHLN